MRMEDKETLPGEASSLSEFASKGDGARQLSLAAIGFVLLALAWQWRDAPANWWAAQTGRRPLLAAKSWYYNLAQIDVDKIAKSDADVLVIDYAKDGGKTPLTPGDVARLKTKADGSQRIVISYMSIGEAEEFRFYWKPEWTVTAAPKPSWEIAPNCAWPGAHAVRYWQDDWKAITIGDGDSYLNRIIAAGFDGVYLDRVDMFSYDLVKSKNPNARADMIAFVTELATRARAKRPGFLVIPQNGEDLLSDRDYRQVIDANSKEDLLYGVAGTGTRNAKDEIQHSVAQLGRLSWDWKPVFVVEYPATRDQVAPIAGELSRLGMVPTFAHRNLDGDDPFIERTRPEAKVGTPEYYATKCDRTNSW